MAQKHFSKRKYILETYKSFISSVSGVQAKSAPEYDDDDDQQSDFFELVLVDIKATMADQQIRCVKRNMYDKDLKYICISYRWGEILEQLASTPDYLSHVTGFKIRDLILLCKYFHQEPDLKDIEFVWVDAISVDQLNHERKKATIYRMNQIYRKCAYIIAVPDLDYEYLTRDNHANKECASFIRAHAKYIYYCLQQDQTKLDKLNEEWLQELGISPMKPEEIPKLLEDRYVMENILAIESTTDVSNAHSDEAQERGGDYNGKNLIDSVGNMRIIDNLWQAVQKKPVSDDDSDDADDADNADEDEDDNDGNDNETLSDEEKQTEQLDVKETDDETTNVNEAKSRSSDKNDSLDVEQVQEKNENEDKTAVISKSDMLVKILQALKMEEWKRLWQDRHKKLVSVFEFIENISEEWSNRAWVISEYHIAREKPSKTMKMWYISLCADDNSVLGLPFIDIHFADDPFMTIESIEESYLHCQSGKDMAARAIGLLSIFLSLNDFLLMMLMSNATRNADRFYAMLPLHDDYKHHIVDKNTISSWNITDTLSVRMKLYEILKLDDRVRLLDACSNNVRGEMFPDNEGLVSDYRKDVPILPSFATICNNESLIMTISYYGELGSQSHDGVLNITRLELGLVIDSDGNEYRHPHPHHVPLFLKSNVSYLATFPHDALPSGFDLLCNELGIPMDELETAAIPFFDTGYNRGINLVGHVAKNIWVVYADVKYEESFYEEDLLVNGWVKRDGEQCYNIF